MGLKSNRGVPEVVPKFGVMTNNNTLSCRWHEMIIFAELGGRLQVPLDALEAHQINERLPGKPRPLLLKVRIQVLVEVVDKTQVDTDQKIIVKRIGCAQDPVLRTT